MAVFSSSTFEIYSKNANEGISSICKCSTAQNKLFGSVFKVNLRNLLQKKKAYAVVANIQLPKKHYLDVFSNLAYEIYSKKANKGICSCIKFPTSPTKISKMLFVVFSSQILKSTLETQIKACAVVANVQHAEKRHLAVFSSSSFEIYSGNANRGICSILNCTTSRKTLYGSVFIINF